MTSQIDETGIGLSQSYLIQVTLPSLSIFGFVAHQNVAHVLRMAICNPKCPTIELE